MLRLAGAALALAAPPFALALGNGFARTPQMGWNPYNAFNVYTTEAQYHQQTDLMVSTGLAALGYNYMIMDSGWQGKSRASNGEFQWDTSRVPAGIPALSSYVHNKNLKFGIYSDGGYFSCGEAGRQGSLNYERQDAKTFAAWGADYLKYDNCFADGPNTGVSYNPSYNLTVHFTAMRDALAATGRPILFSVCEWGVQDPARWPGSAVGNSWRMSDDINASWNAVLRIINQVVPIVGFGGPGGWNDLDLLEVGNSGLTAAEQQTHFAFWAAVKSPLIVSTDLSKISATALAVIKNPRIIALNQDSLGKAISLKRRYTDDNDVWAGPLSDGSTVVLVINWQNNARSLTLQLADVGFASATATDLISGSSLGKLSGSYTATNVAAHGVVVLKLSGAVTVTAPSFTQYPASGFTLAGGATLSTVNSTSVAGYIGQGGTATVKNVNGGNGGTQLVSFDYIDADFIFAGSEKQTNYPNSRLGYVSVNGGTPVKISFPISGQSWTIQYTGFIVPLSGFKAGTSNTITLSSSSGYSPNIVRVGVASPSTAPGTTVAPPTTSQTGPTTSQAEPTTSVTSAPPTTTTSGGGSGCSVSLYGQCGGSGYSGCTTCASGTCKYSNDYYSQCL